MKPSYLIKGFPGHPLHPPFTDATIGIFTFAAIAGVLGALGVAEPSMAKGWWLALVVGLIVAAPTALTGLADWLEITWGTPLWRTATLHLVSMVSAVVLFALAAIFGHAGYAGGEVTGGALVLTLAGFALLTLGGWIGGAIVYVHGMRVLGLLRAPTRAAITPGAKPEDAEADGPERRS